MTPVERLMSRRVIDGSCWIYKGGRTRNGYGSISVGGRAYYTHRLSYEAYVGPIPAGLDLDHLCRTRGCFNPAHLEPVTRGENLRRGDSGAHNKVKTRCPSGHEYSPDNTYINSGRRFCRACRRAREQARKAVA